jgi:hypothetical protein
VIPDGFIPVLFEGIAPAKPKAASPAKGFFDSPDICRRGGKKRRKNPNIKTP